MAYFNGVETVFSPLSISSDGVVLQTTKEVVITENGEVTISADDGYAGMVKLLATIDVPAVEEWQAGVVYEPDDIVTFNGVYYICIKKTQGYLDDPESFPDEWEKVNGTLGGYKGEYSANASYSAGDIVTLNGSIYQANVDDPATPPDNNMANHWTVLYSGTNSQPSGTLSITENGTHDVTNYASVSVNITTYKGEYDDSVAYKQGDIVVYQGNVYQCTSDMSSGGCNPVDMSTYWNGGTPLNSNITQVEEWGSGNSYTEGTIVTYNGVYYICILTHGGYPASPDNDSERWSKVNGSSGGDSSSGLVTLKAGTYTLSTSAYYSNYTELPYRFEITESISGSYSLVNSSISGTENGSFSNMKFSGVGSSQCPDAPYINMYFDGAFVVSYNRGGTITINSDTQVSATFYTAFMGIVA